MEVEGDECVLAAGDLDAIEAYLNSPILSLLALTACKHPLSA